MDAREYLSLKPVQEKHEFQEFDEHDEEEALSLRDLALNNSNAVSDWNDDRDDRYSSFDQDLFEFFSEDFTASAYARDSIIFCGKLIPYKGDKEDVKNLDKSVSEAKDGMSSCIFPGKSFSLNRSRSSSMKVQQEKSYRTSKTFPESSLENNEYNMKSKVDKYDVSRKKGSFLTSPTRSKWYLFAFGGGRYPTEMELRDIKTRQSKPSDSKMRRSTKTPAKKFRPNDSRELAQRRRKREKGWWSLLKILGCTSNDANAMVNASLRFMPLQCVSEEFKQNQYACS